MKWLKFTLPIVIFAAGFGGMKLIEVSAQEQGDKQPVDTRPTVTLTSLNVQDVSPMITSYGEVMPLETTRLAAQVAGEVVYWHPDFLPGGIVKRGEVLFSVRKDSYEAALLQAEAALSSAESLLIQEQAQAEVAKKEARSLPASRVTDLYLRKPQLLSAEAAVKSAKAMLRAAQRDLANCEVRAPYDALVVSRSIGTGEYVGPGTVAAVLNNIESAEVTFPVAGFDMQHLPSSSTAPEITVTVPGEQRTRMAQLHRDAGIVDSATRMLHLVARIQDPYALNSAQIPVRFGSYVSLQFAGKPIPQVYEVPQDLVTQRRLWLLDKEDRLHSQPVNVVREQGKYFLIEADFDASRVVSNVPEYPQEGMSVRVIAPAQGMLVKQASDIGGQ